MGVIREFFGAELGRVISTGAPLEMVQTTGTLATVTSSRARTGTYSAKLNPTSGQTMWFNPRPNSNAAGLAKAYVTFWLNIETRPTTAAVVLYKTDLSNFTINPPRLRLNTDGSIQFEYDANTAGGANYTVVGAASSVLALDTWHRIDLTVEQLDVSNGMDLSWKVNGSTVGSVTNVSTRGTTNHTFVQSLFGDSAAAAADTFTVYIDDLITRDDALETSQGGVLIMKPDGNGNYTAWTGTFADIDERPFDGNDDGTGGTVITSGTASQAETATLESTSSAGILGDVRAVGPFAIGATASGSAVITTRIRSGTTDRDNPSGGTTVGATTWKANWDLTDVDPATSAAWTLSGLDALEAGVVHSSGAVTVRVTAVGVMVYATGPVQAPAGAATGTGAAYSALGSGMAPGIASGTGQAYNAIANAAWAGHASGTGSASGATVNVAPNAGQVTGTGAAGDVNPSTIGGAMPTHRHDTFHRGTVPNAQLGPAEIELIIGGGGSAITTGVKGDLRLPFAGTFTAARLLADQTGSIVVDLWKDTYANFPPTVADTITASAKPTLSSAVKSEDTTLTGWTTAFAAGDILRVNVDSASTVTRVLLSLTVTRT